jgi:hypothetical protein
MMSRSTEVLHRRAHELLEVRHLADVSIDTSRAIPECHDLLLEIFGRLLVGDVVDHDVRALVGQREHDRLPDPGVATRDDRNLALQAHRTSS